MAINKKSQEIAKYIQENGINPYNWVGKKDAREQMNGQPKHYLVSRSLKDGRIFRAYFHDVNGGFKSPHRNSILEIRLEPNRPDQFGYRTVEHGLTGEFDTQVIILGIDEVFPQGRIRFDRRLSTPVQVVNLQVRYERILEEAHRTLHEA